MKKTILGLTALLFAALACNLGNPATQPSQPSVETVVTETIQAVTVNVPPSGDITATPAPSTQGGAQLTPDGTPVETSEISFIIPNGVANDVTSIMTKDVEYPYINPSLGDMPQHLVISLNLYAVADTVYSPKIMIFRADEYGAYSEMTAETINTLRTLQYAEGQPLPNELDTTFTAQIHGLNFQNGHGIRYLTQVMQNFAAITNEELFYYYQGITNDGMYFVEAILPINTAFLPANGRTDTPLPTDGIPINLDDFQGYANAVKEKLNNTETYNFNPYLDALDEMIGSVQVKGF